MVWHYEGLSETKVFVHNELKIAHCNTAMSNKYTPFQSGTHQSALSRLKWYVN